MPIPDGGDAIYSDDVLRAFDTYRPDDTITFDSDWRPQCQWWPDYDTPDIDWLMTYSDYSVFRGHSIDDIHYSVLMIILTLFWWNGRVFSDPFDDWYCYIPDDSSTSDDLVFDLFVLWLLLIQAIHCYSIHCWTEKYCSDRGWWRKW